MSEKKSMSTNRRILIVQSGKSCDLQLPELLLQIGFSDILTLSSYNDALEQLLNPDKATPHFLFIEGLFCSEEANFIKAVMANARSSETNIIVMQQPEQNILWAFQLGAIGHIQMPCTRTDLEKVFSRFPF